MALTDEEQAELERLNVEFQAFSGRGVELADRIDYLTEKESWTGVLGCPECGDTYLATIEKLTGYSILTEVTADDLTYEGTTEMDWDSTTTVGVRCMACWWTANGTHSEFAKALKPPYELHSQHMEE